MPHLLGAGSPAFPDAANYQFADAPGAPIQVLLLPPPPPPGPGGNEVPFTEADRALLTAIFARLGTLPINVAAPLIVASRLTLTAGDDYLLADGRALAVSLVGVLPVSGSIAQLEDIDGTVLAASVLEPTATPNTTLVHFDLRRVVTRTFTRRSTTTLRVRVIRPGPAGSRFVVAEIRMEVK